MIDFKPYFTWLRALLKDNPVLPWVVAFLILNIAVTQYGGTNAKSRYAALRAITESHTINIDKYKGWTLDWSLSPNGHYYSNKAPGPVLLGLPVFAATDSIAALTTKARDENGLRPEPGYAQHLFLVLIMQMLPISLIVLWLGKRLPVPAAHFFALAALFGNTAAFFFNSYFGHGLAAIFFLSCFLAIKHHRFAWAGLFFGCTLLSDYAAATALPAVLILLWQERTKIKNNFSALLLGGTIPGALWIWYHTAAFGSPFAIASAFINPDQVTDVPTLLPQWAYLKGLLFGPERGILFTQPWVYIGLIALFFTPRRAAVFPLVSLFGAVWLCATTSSWHGGFTAGPRYIAFLFPAIAAAMAYAWNCFPSIAKGLLWITLGISVLLRALLYPFSNLAPLENLWTYHLHALESAEHGTPALRLTIFIAVFFAAIFFVWKKHRTLRQYRA